jgi:hypothetical protein
MDILKTRKHLRMAFPLDAKDLIITSKRGFLLLIVNSSKQFLLYHLMQHKATKTV